MAVNRIAADGQIILTRLLEVCCGLCVAVLILEGRPQTVSGQHFARWSFA